ncbi:MAG TPA: flagellar filament outer layer protein FlaA [Spirochaetales bacterium]|nr:flagellar filament outer layer protein FlaA [Spirochaetales bacterium]
MKQRVVKAVGLSLVLTFLFAVPSAFADDETLTLESIVVQNFDKMDEQPWFVIGSKFSSEGYPKVASVKAWPVSLHGPMAPDKDFRSLGIAMLFDRKEYNWVDIVPGTKTGTGADVKYSPVELPLPGRVRMLDMWIWSGNFNYYIEAYIRDYTGIVHIIPLGELNHVGWRNFRANLPGSIPQSKKFLPKKEGLTFVKFRIWSRPTEVAAVPTRADSPAYEKAIYFYFDHLKVLTDTFESLYDGDSLSDPEFIKEIWGSDSTK